MFVARADIVVDDSQFCINAVWGDGWKDNLEFDRFAGIFYASQLKQKEIPVYLSTAFPQ